MKEIKQGDRIKSDTGEAVLYDMAGNSPSDTGSS